MILGHMWPERLLQVNPYPSLAHTQCQVSPGGQSNHTSISRSTDMDSSVANDDADIYRVGRLMAEKLAIFPQIP